MAMNWDGLHWELSVLRKAVAYKNLSAASDHIGLSQPQLSRIVQKIEDTAGILLLDRSSRRNSNWTRSAVKLAETYAKHSRALEGELSRIVKQSELDVIKIGTLEGLVELASKIAHRLLSRSQLTRIELDVHDLDRLESLFGQGELDVILASREPGRKKYRHSIELGFQALDRVSSDPKTVVASTFEFNTHNKSLFDHAYEKTIVSNSLAVRKFWLSEFGGTGHIPSAVKSEKPQERAGQDRIIETAHLVGSDILSHELWEKIVTSSNEIRSKRNP